MKKFLWLIPMSLVLLLGAAGCNGKTIKVDETMNGQTIEVQTGDTIAVTLAGNPTTGFSWVVSDLDAAILSQQGEAEFKADSNLLGSGGMVTTNFKAEGPGTVALTLSYMRAWESVQPLQVFTVTVEVK